MASVIDVEVSCKNHECPGCWAQRDEGVEPEHCDKCGVALGFRHEGMWVTDPWLDESGRFEVDPVAHYGAAFTTWLAQFSDGVVS